MHGGTERAAPLVIALNATNLVAGTARNLTKAVESS